MKIKHNDSVLVCPKKYRTTQRTIKLKICDDKIVYLLISMDIKFDFLSCLYMEIKHIYYNNWINEYIVHKMYFVI